MSDWIQGCNGIDRSLRARWRTASLAAGWPFPSDWGVRAVDRVCRAVVLDDDLDEPLGRLGAARAEAGVGLAEALLDVAALHAVRGGADGLVSPDPDAVPARVLRPVALGWAEVQAEYVAGSEVRDPLTGLTTPPYLRTRLHEVYRAARAAGRPAEERYELVTVSVGIPPDTGGYPLMMAMVLVADVLRDVFDAGETAALLRPDTAAVLGRSDPGMAERCERVRRQARERIAGDPGLAPVGPVRVHRDRLPDDHAAACSLLGSLD
ncbi:hypothetical protein ACL03H_17675 [Saccharopolyspora sp. MS10]|uniref:hypothetical protein n=1 Tax=Saccharopolyspora sp. MS10 TaxID=3385973 RepID=UPI0039A2525B